MEFGRYEGMELGRRVGSMLVVDRNKTETDRGLSATSVFFFSFSRGRLHLPVM